MISIVQPLFPHHYARLRPEFRFHIPDSDFSPGCFYHGYLLNPVRLFGLFLPVNANWKMSFFAGMGCHFLAVSMRWVCSLDYPLLVGLKPVKS